MQALLNRSSDLLARYGGEEFVAILPETDMAGARTIAEKLRHAVIEQQIPHTSGIDGVVTISIGVASGLPKSGVDAQKFLQLADQCLYHAKVLGRNRIHCESCCGQLLSKTG
jgi:two-component system, sensor histidine kinase LadS